MTLPQYVTVFGEVLLDILGTRLSSFINTNKHISDKGEQFQKKFVLNREFVSMLMNVFRQIIHSLSLFNSSETTNIRQFFEK